MYVGAGCKTDHCSEDVGVFACSQVEWKAALYPNTLGQGPRQAEPIASKFWHQLHTIDCGRDFRFVVCSLLAPPCRAGVTKPLPPCREICEAAVDHCLPIMTKNYLTWPDDTFNCHQLPYSNQEPCLKYRDGEVIFPQEFNQDCSKHDYEYFYDNYSYEDGNYLDHLPTLEVDDDDEGGDDDPQPDSQGSGDGIDSTVWDIDFVPNEEEYYDNHNNPQAPSPTLTKSSIPATIATTTTTTTTTTTPTPTTTTTSPATPIPTVTPKIRFAPVPTPLQPLPPQHQPTTGKTGAGYLQREEYVNG